MPWYPRHNRGKSIIFPGTICIGYNFNISFLHKNGETCCYEKRFRNYKLCLLRPGLRPGFRCKSLLRFSVGCSLQRKTLIHHHLCPVSLALRHGNIYYYYYKLPPSRFNCRILVPLYAAETQSIDRIEKRRTKAIQWHVNVPLLAVVVAAAMQLIDLILWQTQSERTESH